MISSVGMFRLRSAWYICSLPTEGTLKSFCPTRKRVGDPARNGRIHGTEEVDDLLVPPVAVDRGAVRLAAAVAAAVVHREHRIAVRGEQLPLEHERMVVLRARAAVDAEEERHLAALPA